MPVRPGRLLPSVIVGALVTGALALGAGTALAAPTDGAPCYVGETQGKVDGANCVTSGGSILGSLLEATLGRLPVVEVEPPPTTTTTTRTTTSSTVPRTTTATTRTSPPVVVERSRVVAPAPPPAQIARPPAPVAAPQANLLSPALGSPGGLAAGTPALGFGTLDPSLLLAPAGSPLRTLTGVDEGSPVTTVSDVQAMAFDDLPGGLGTPAITGTLILSAFAAFALRHRVLRRARLAADADSGSEADTAEISTREPVA